jgi:hypothetical protein
LNRRTALTCILVVYVIVCSVLWFGGALKPTIVQIPGTTHTVRIVGPGGTETIEMPVEGSTQTQLEQGQVVLIASIVGSGLLLVTLTHVYLPSPRIPASTPEANVYCIECGARNPSTYKYCGKCGSRLEMK